MGNTRTLSIVIGATLSGGFGRSVNAARDQLNRLGRSVKDLEGQYSRLRTNAFERKDAAGERLKNMRGHLLALTGAAYGASKVVGQAMNFESVMADVRKVVDFKTIDGFEKLGATLKRMSLVIPITADGLAQIAAAGGQLGVAADDLPAFTETVAKMATAFDMLPDVAGDSMAKLANIYNIPINEMGRLGDAINHLSDNTAAKARDIVPVLTRAGGAGRQFGLSAVQVAALGDAFIALGKAPEVAGTAINAMLLKLQTASKQGNKFQDALSEIGLSAEEMESAIADDGQAALTDFLERLSGLDKGERAGILTDLFGLEYSDDISLLAGSMDAYRKALSLVTEESAYAGSMQREFATRSATTANQLQLMRNSISRVAINLGSTLLPAVNSVLKPIMAFSVWVGDMVERFPVIGRLIGGVSSGIGIFVASLAAVTAATWLWNAALAANPITWVVGAVIGAAALIMAYWEPVSKFFQDYFQGLVSGIAPVIDALRPFFPLFSSIGRAIGSVWSWFSKLITPVGDAAGKLDDATSAGMRFGELVGKAITTILTPFTTYAKVLGWVGEKLGLFSGSKEQSKPRPGRSLRKAAGAAALGTALVAAPVSAADIGFPEFSDMGAPTVQNERYENVVNAPITINAHPGMDEKAVAAEVDRKLREREKQAAVRRRGALYD